MIAWWVVAILAADPTPKPKQKPKITAAKRNPKQIASAYTGAASENPKLRSAAFLTLSKQGLEKKLPDPEPNDPNPVCVELKSDGACQSTAFVCNRSVEIDAEETHYSSLDRMIGFGSTKAEAEADLPAHLMSKALKSGPESTDMQCVVVFLDGCVKRAGMVCTTAVERVGSGSDPAPKTEVFDLQFK